jgi:hypothetical protein
MAGTWYRTGTVAVTNGSKIVTGTATEFAKYVSEGFIFLAAGKVCEVDTIDSDLQLTLAEDFEGATAAGVRYACAPTQATIPPLTKRVTQLLGDMGPVKDDYDSGNLLTSEALSTPANVPAYAFSAEEAQSIFDNALPMQSYAALRAYTGRAAGVRITSTGFAGTFQRDTSDVTSADNGGTVIVDVSGRRWKRQYSGPAMVEWWGARGVGNDGPALQLALDFGGWLYTRWHHITKQKLFATKEGTRLMGPCAAWGGEVTAGARIVADVSLNADFILEFKNPLRGALRSVGLEDICIDGGASNAGGLAVRGAYDASAFRNINIINVPGARVGLDTSAGNTLTREGPIQTSTFKNIWALHRDGEICTRPAVILGDIHESTAENIKGSHGSNMSTAPAFVIQSCNGVQIVTPSAINVSGYGIVVRENHGPCVGVTIIGATYEKCKQPFGTDSKDTRMFGAGLPIVALGSVVRQPADGSTASGTVWQSTNVGIYAKDTIGTFALGNVYDGSGNLIGEITALPSVGSSSIRHINPRTLSVNLSNAAQSAFKALSRSEIELPMDTQTEPKHTYLVTADVTNSLFREKEWGVTTNLSATSRVESGVGEIVMGYPDRWPLSGTAVNLANFATQSRIRITKNGGELAITIAGAGISIGKYGVTTLTMYEGYITLQRSGTSKWDIADMGGAIKDAAQGMICGIPRVVAVTATTAFDSTAHDRVFTNTGAAGPVAINAGTAGGSGPAIALGTRVTLTKTAAQSFYFKPNAADTVLGASAAGKYIAPTAVGSSVTLECMAANTWAIIASAGTFSYEP